MAVAFWIHPPGDHSSSEPQKRAEQTEVIQEGNGLAFAKPSGNPVVPYTVTRSEAPSFEGWIFVVPTTRPTVQQLIDLAFDVRAKYPSTRCEIVDSTASIAEIQDFYAHPSAEGTELKHEFAMLNDFFDRTSSAGARWKLVDFNGHTIAAFQDSPGDITERSARLERGRVGVEREEAEQHKCKSLQGKAIGDLSLSDLTKLRECEAEGWF